MNTKTLITLGMKCPRPLFEVSKTMKTVAAGEQLEVVADDPAFKLDIEAWCRRTGTNLVSINIGPNGRIVALLCKSAA